MIWLTTHSPPWCIIPLICWYADALLKNMMVFHSARGNQHTFQKSWTNCRAKMVRMQNHLILPRRMR